MQPNLSYNSWLRDTADELRSTLVKNMDRLLVQLPVVQLELQQEGTSTERLTRCSLAVIHLMTELHLLLVTTDKKMEEMV